jgi:hypothetical protein
VKQDLTLSQQLLFLQANPAIGGSGAVRANRLLWQTPIQPTALARTYQASVTYLPGETPTVRIDAPDLELLAGGRSLHHVYNNPLRLCLYLPGTGEWNARKRIDETIIPWTYLWLYYFEDWLGTDVWKGGGRHPEEEPDETGNRALRRAVARY